MPQPLDVSLTAIDGPQIATITDYSQCEVEVPINDGRTARVTCSLYNEGVADIVKDGAALKVFLKIRYYGIPVFWGPLTRPRIDFPSGTIELPARDLSLRLERTFLRNGDYAVDTGYDVGGGTGMWQLLEAARLAGTAWETHTPAIPDLSIAEGFTDYGGTFPTTSTKALRGDNLWQKILDFSESRAGPDFEIRPIDEQYNPNGSDLHDPVTDWRNVSEFNVYDRQGDPDKWETLRFHHGFGRDNAEVTWEQGGDQVVNYVVAVGGDDNTLRKFARNVTSWEEVGIYQAWDAGASNDADVLEYRAHSTVKAYSRAPNYFTVAPRNDPPTARFAYRYMQDFEVGDAVLVAAKRSGVFFEETGRITKVTLTLDEDSGLVQQALEVVPDVADDSEIATGDA